ncbi:MAG: hypothetical protein ACRDV9_01605 [Acidimicrobiia bacterium]
MTHLNGPLTEEEAGSVEAVVGSGQVARFTSVTAVLRAGDLETRADLYLLDRSAPSRLTWFALGLLIRGEGLDRGDRNRMVIDVYTAERLEVTVGDEIVVEAPLAHRPRYRMPVVGIYASSGPTRQAGLVAPSSLGEFVRQRLATTRRGAAGGGVVSSDLLVGSGAGGAAVRRSLGGVLSENPDLLVEGRAEKLGDARRSPGDSGTSAVSSLLGLGLPATKHSPLRGDGGPRRPPGLPSPAEEASMAGGRP